MTSRLEQHTTISSYKDPYNVQNTNKETKRKNVCNSLDYKGMTLKQYFRLSEVQPKCFGNQIKQTQQQNIHSQIQASTPYFNDYNNVRQKIKTQVFEEKSYIKQKNSFGKGPNLLLLQFQNKTKQLRKQKFPLENISKKQHKNLNKNIHALAPNKSHLNRSTVTSFYQLEAKKKKMLDKLKYQKQRINELKLSDVCFITKYAQKFHIDSNKGY